MLFSRHAFGDVQYFGAPDHKVAPGATDRLVAVAQFSDRSDKPSTLPGGGRVTPAD
jgi:hypothetical protein